MEPMVGLEPTMFAYRVTNAGPSPLGYIGTIGCEPESNRRPRPYQGRVLPTELSQHGSGTPIRTESSAFKGRRVTRLLHIPDRRARARVNASGHGFEPQSRGSEPRILPLDEPESYGAGAGARTRTVRLKRPLRCRSRPAGKNGRCGRIRTDYRGVKSAMLILMSFAPMVLDQGFEP